MTVIKTVRKGWTEQYGLMVYELVASVGGEEFRAVRTVTTDTHTHAAAQFELEAKEQVTKEITAKYEQA